VEEMRYIRACQEGAWTLSLHRRDDPEDKLLVRFRCRSWRHEGDCRRWKGAQDFARIRQGLSARKTGKVYAVLTLDQRKYNGDLWAAYRGLLTRWASLRKRMTRAFGKVEYVCLVEQHRNGFPHLNLIIVNERLAAACAGTGWKSVRRGWLEPNAVACGFGFRTWIEPVRDEEAIAGYAVKLLGHQEVVDEVSKTLQVPTKAPKHFRRLRASRGFLPPPYKNDEYTGQLIMETVEDLEWLTAIYANSIRRWEAREDSTLTMGACGEVYSLTHGIDHGREPRVHPMPVLREAGKRAGARERRAASARADAGGQGPGAREGVRVGAVAVGHGLDPRPGRVPAASGGSGHGDDGGRGP